MVSNVDQLVALDGQLLNVVPTHLVGCHSLIGWWLWKNSRGESRDSVGVRLGET